MAVVLFVVDRLSAADASPPATLMALQVALEVTVSLGRGTHNTDLPIGARLLRQCRLQNQTCLIYAALVVLISRVAFLAQSRSSHRLMALPASCTLSGARRPARVGLPRS